MPNYENSCIYKIISKDINIPDVYVGSTTNFKSRSKDHKKRSKKLDEKLYNFIRANGNWDNFEMIKIEDFPCSSKREVETREQFWITELKSTLNINKAFRTREDENMRQRIYYQNNKEKKTKKILEWREVNKERWNAYRREWRAKKKLEKEGQ